MNNENIFGGVGQQPIPPMQPVQPVQQPAQPLPPIQPEQQMQMVQPVASPQTTANPNPFAIPPGQPAASAVSPGNPFVATGGAIGSAVNAPAMPPQQPVGFVQPVATGAMPMASRPKKFPWLVVGLGLGSLAIIGIVLGYFLWYQNPEKVLADALAKMIVANSMTVSGSIEVVGSGEYATIEKVEVLIDNEMDTVSGKTDVSLKMSLKDMKPIVIKASSVVIGVDEIYVRFDGVMDVVNIVMGDFGDTPGLSSVLEVIEEIAKKIEGRWIKISYSELLGDNEEFTKQIDCYNGVLEKVSNDKRYQQEIVSLYKKNKFVIIRKELGMQDGAYGFELSANPKAAMRFAMSLRNTSLYEEMAKCNESLTDLGEESEEYMEEYLNDLPDDILDELPDGTMFKLTVWVSALKHELKTLQIDAAYEQGGYYSEIPDKYEYHQEFKFVLNKPVSILAPADWISMKTLMEEIMELVNEMMYGGGSYDIYSSVLPEGDDDYSIARRDTMRKDYTGQMLSANIEYLSNNRGKAPRTTETICFGSAFMMASCDLDPYVMLPDGLGYVIGMMPNGGVTGAYNGSTNEVIAIWQGARCGSNENGTGIDGSLRAGTSARQIAAVVLLEATGNGQPIYYCQEG